MSSESWLIVAVVLLSVGAYMAMRNREWGIFTIACLLLMYAVPQLPNALA